MKRRSRFFDDIEDFDGRQKRRRPKSAIYLDPEEMLGKGQLKNKTKSCRSVSSRGTSGNINLLFGYDLS